MEVVEFNGQPIEIRRVQLAGVSRPAVFVMYTYTLFKRKTGIDIYSLSEDDNLSNEDALQLYHCALVVGGIVTKEPFEIEFEPDFLIMCDEAALVALSGIKQQTEAVDVDDSEANADEPKKKETKVSASKTSRKRAPVK